MWAKLKALFWGSGIPCVFHLVTGAYCPGCGGTRAAKALLSGHILTSLRYNPVVAYAAAVAAVFCLQWLAARVRRKKTPPLRRLEPFLYMGILLALANFVYKNYMLLARGVDLLS